MAGVHSSKGWRLASPVVQTTWRLRVGLASRNASKLAGVVWFSRGAGSRDWRNSRPAEETPANSAGGNA